MLDPFQTSKQFLIDTWGSQQRCFLIDEQSKPFCAGRIFCLFRPLPAMNLVSIPSSFTDRGGPLYPQTTHEAYKKTPSEGLLRIRSGPPTILHRTHTWTDADQYLKRKHPPYTWFELMDDDKVSAARNKKSISLMTIKTI